jgi:hypothetical protein
LRPSRERSSPAGIKTTVKLKEKKKGLKETRLEESGVGVRGDPAGLTVLPQPRQVLQTPTAYAPVVFRDRFGVPSDAGQCSEEERPTGGGRESV